MNQEQISESAIWWLDKVNRCKWLEEEGRNWKSHWVGIEFKALFLFLDFLAGNWGT